MNKGDRVKVSDVFFNDDSFDKYKIYIIKDKMKCVQTDFESCSIANRFSRRFNREGCEGYKYSVITDGCGHPLGGPWCEYKFIRCLNWRKL